MEKEFVFYSCCSCPVFYWHLLGISKSAKEKRTSWHYPDKSHLSHSFLVMIVHLTDQSIAEVHSNSLDGLILPGWLQDFQQQLVDPTVLELQLLWNTEVTQSQAAVPLDLVWGRKGNTGRFTSQNWKLYYKSEEQNNEDQIGLKAKH